MYYDFKIVLVIMALIMAVSVALSPLFVWRLWMAWRLSRRRILYERYAADMGMTCMNDRDDSSGEIEIPEVDAHMRCEREGFQVDVYERLCMNRSADIPFETQTIVEISRLGREIPEFLIQPLDDTTRFLHRTVKADRVKMPANPRFGNENLVSGKDEDAIRDLMVPSVTKSLGWNKEYWVDSSPKSIRFFKFETLLDLSKIDGLIDQALLFAKAIRDTA